MRMYLAVMVTLFVIGLSLLVWSTIAEPWYTQPTWRKTVYGIGEVLFGAAIVMGAGYVMVGLWVWALGGH